MARRLTALVLPIKSSPPDKLLDGAKEMARRIGGMRPGAVTMAKATSRAVRDKIWIGAHRGCTVMPLSVC